MTGDRNRIDQIEAILLRVVAQQEVTATTMSELTVKVDTLTETVAQHQRNFEVSQRNFDIIQSNFERVQANIERIETNIQAMQSEIRGLQLENRRMLEELRDKRNNEEQ